MFQPFILTMVQTISYSYEEVLSCTIDNIEKLDKLPITTTQILSSHFSQVYLKFLGSASLLANLSTKPGRKTPGDWL